MLHSGKRLHEGIIFGRGHWCGTRPWCWRMLTEADSCTKKDLNTTWACLRMTGWWYTYPLEKYGMMTFPNIWLAQGIHKQRNAVASIVSDSKRAGFPGSSQCNAACDAVGASTAVNASLSRRNFDWQSFVHRWLHWIDSTSSIGVTCLYDHDMWYFNILLGQTKPSPLWYICKYTMMIHIDRTHTRSTVCIYANESM